MKKAAVSAIVLGATLGLASTAALAKVSVVQRGDTTDMRFTVDDVKFESAQGLKAAGVEFKRAKLQGVAGYEAIQYAVGQPEVPVLRFFAEGDVTVSVEGTPKSGALAPSVKLVPSQPSRVKLPVAPLPLAFDKNAYAQKSSLNKAAFSIENAGSIDGVARKLVTLYPLAYSAGDGKYQIRSSFTVSVKRAKRDPENARQIFAFVVGERFENSASLNDYITVKEALGFEVQKIVVRAGDTPETIRAALKALYARTDAKLAHALLVGDSADVPGKESAHIAGVTDHYYRAIDTDDYESDINGPDIGVGRVAVDSDEQLEAVLAKFKRYNTGVFSDERWLNGVAFLATDDRHEVAEGTHNYVIETYTAPKAYMGVFPNAEQLGGDQLYAITHQVTDPKVLEVMNLGRTIIDYSGHGSNYGWHGPTITQDNVRSLTDPNALPFVVGNACITGDYRVAESFAETWQRHPAGAIVYWGSMDSSYWDEDDFLERAMFDHIYRDGELNFAAFTDFALGDVWRQYGGEGRSKYYWETYVLFGDPSLDLRTTKTRRIAVDGPAALPIGIGSVDYTVTDAEGPVAGARVSLANDRGDYKLAGVTDADGKVTFDIAAAARDVVNFKVSVTGANTAASESELRIVPSDTPYLSLASFGVNGRNDTSVYLAEVAALGFAVANVGQQPTSGGKVTIDSVEGPASMLRGEAEVPAMAARSNFQYDGDELALAVNADAQSGAAIKVKLKWTTNEGQTNLVPVTLRVLRGVLTVVKTDFGAADGEGGIRPGEAGDVYLTVKNTGTETIARGALSAVAGACVTSVDGELALETVLPGASVRLAQPLHVTLDSACTNGATAKVAFNGFYPSVATQVALAAEASFPAGVVAEASRELEGLALPIVDNLPTEVAIETGIQGVVKDVGLQVRLTHTYVGDLLIKLVHADGTEVVLYDRAGGASDNIDLMFGLGGTAVADLAKLTGKDAGGTWKLVVEDTASQDQGTLEYVKLTIRGYVGR